MLVGPEALAYVRQTAVVRSQPRRAGRRPARPDWLSRGRAGRSATCPTTTTHGGIHTGCLASWSMTPLRGRLLWLRERERLDAGGPFDQGELLAFRKFLHALLHVPRQLVQV